MTIGEDVRWLANLASGDYFRPGDKCPRCIDGVLDRPDIVFGDYATSADFLECGDCLLRIDDENPED
jgi:hypothetical protein